MGTNVLANLATLHDFPVVTISEDSQNSGLVVPSSDSIDVGSFHLLALSKIGSKTMKLVNLIAAGAVLSMSLAPITTVRAQADAEKLTADYLVVRDGKVISTPSGTPLSGDRIITRGSKGTMLAFSGCSLGIPPASMATIAADGCASIVKTLQYAGPTKSAGGRGLGKATLVGLALLGPIWAFFKWLDRKCGEEYDKMIDGIELSLGGKSKKKCPPSP